MRPCFPQALRALSLAGLLLPGAAAEAQNPPTSPRVPEVAPSPVSPSPEEQAAPIEAFDFQRALVGEAGGLTSDEAARRVLARSPQIASARASATAAEWDAKNAWSSFLPQLQIFAQYRRINEVNNAFSFGPTPEQIATLPQETQNLLQLLFPEDGGADFTQPVDNYALGATLRVPVSDIFLRVMPSYEAAKGFSKTQSLQAEATAAVVERQAREAFYAYAAAIAARAVAEQAVKQAEAQAEQTKLFVDAGTAAPVEFMQATAQLEIRKSQLATFEGALANTRNALATLMGVPAESIQGMGEAVLEAPQPLQKSPEQLVAHGIEHRPELRALRTLVEANQDLQAAERNAAWPQFYLEGSDLYANPNPRYVPPVNEFNNSWEVSANLAWSPNQSLTGYQRGKRAGANVAKARADLISLEDQTRIEVMQHYHDYKVAAAQALATEASLKAAEEAYRVRLAMYRVGAGVIVDLRNADQDVNQARLQRIQALIGARVALARLNQAAALKVQ